MITMRALAWTTTVAMVLTVIGCAAGTAGSGPSGGRNFLTDEEIRATNAQNLYDVIRLRRPRWLERERPTAVMPERESEIVVYVDNVRYGAVEQLRLMSPSVAVSIQYLSASEAQARFGPGHLQGVIHVVTRS